MTRYIVVDELLDALNSQDLADWLDEQDEYTPASIVEHALETLPTIDAIPVEWILEYKEQFAQVSSDECDVGKAETLVDLLADWAERREE